LGIKGLVLLKNLISYPFRLLGWITKFLFKDFLYNILTKIYYQAFRLRNKGIVKNSTWELLWRQPIYLLIFVLVVVISLSSIIRPSSASAMQTKIHKTVISSLLQNEFTMQPEELIVEGANSLNMNLIIGPDKYSDELLALRKEEELSAPEKILPIDSMFFNEEHDLILKPIPGDFPSESEDVDAIPVRKEIVEYVVRPGDTVSSIARRFGITVNTVLWANNLNSYSLLRIGDKLTILPQSGLLYTVKRGDTLAQIAQTYKIDINRIIETNSLGDSLLINQKIILPGAQRIVAASAPRPAATSYTGVSVIKDLVSPPAKPSTTKLAWPTSATRITQYFSWRHPGLDIADKVGTPLYAAEDGKVIISQGGWNGGYGNTIVIDHGGGMRTRYAHASQLYVSVGDTVKRGEVIATMGSTGRSTGSHLHFEVIINGTKYNPLNYIR
jgi:murein DD-endopeptidase MepM/ murein hydrolase activator NlpD